VLVARPMCCLGYEFVVAAKGSKPTSTSCLSRFQQNRAVDQDFWEIQRADARNSSRYAAGFRLSKRSRSPARSG
jgi:hypothetical protein